MINGKEKEDLANKFLNDSSIDLSKINDSERKKLAEIMTQFNIFVKQGKLQEAKKYLNHINNELRNTNGQKDTLPT